MFAVLNKEKNTKLHTLGLGWVNLSTVDPDVLARVVDRVENVYRDTDLNTKQLH